MNIQKLTVHLTNSKKLGTLAQKDRKIYFEYDKDFLKTGIEISPYKLPLKAGLHICNDDTFEGIWGVFNLFTHNRDDHAKNFSFLMDAKGEWRFSPVYDVTFSNGPEGAHSTMYLGESKNPTKEHLKALAKKHQLKNADKILQEVYEAVQ